MNVLVVPAGKDASANLRLVWPAATLANRGHTVRVANPDTWRLDVFLDKTNDVAALTTIPDCDVIVFQRLHDRHMAQAVPFLQRTGIAVVVDVDDHFGAVDPANVAWNTVHPTEVPDKAWRWLDVACANADLVTVTTPALAAHYGRAHGRAVVLPNRLPEQILSIPPVPNRHPRQIGWTGDIKTHPRDLQVVGPAVAQVLAETGADRVWNVGPGGITKPLGVAREYVTGYVEARGWYSTIAALIDIGIAPLADTKFNLNKSGLKLLELSALGIPCVASPTPDNQRLHALGMGVLADKPKEWRRELRRLATDDAWYREVAERSKEAARGETLEAHASLWWDAWTMAYERHRR